MKIYSQNSFLLSSPQPLCGIIMSVSRGDIKVIQFMIQSPRSPSKRRQRQKQPFLFLVQPFERLSESFGTLRNKLKRKNIDFNKCFGFEEVKELVNRKTGYYLVLINNQNNKGVNVPVELIETNRLSIYFYPESSDSQRFGTLPNVHSVIRECSRFQIIRKRHAIRIKSISTQIDPSMPKKVELLHAFQSKNMSLQYAEMLKVMNGDGVRLFSEKKKIEQIRNYSMVLIEIQNLDSIILFLKKKDKRIYLLVFGIENNQNLIAPNVLKATEDPLELLQFLAGCGFAKRKWKQKLEEYYIKAEEEMQTGKEKSSQEVVKKEKGQKDLVIENKVVEKLFITFSDKEIPKNTILQVSEQYKESNLQSVPLEEKKISNEDGLEERKKMFDLLIKKNQPQKEKIPQPFVQEKIQDIKQQMFENPQKQTKEPEDYTNTKSEEQAKEQISFVPKTLPEIQKNDKQFVDEYPKTNSLISPVKLIQSDENYQKYKQNHTYDNHIKKPYQITEYKQVKKSQPRQQSKIIKSNNFNFDDYDRCVEDGIVIYKPKVRQFDEKRIKYSQYQEKQKNSREYGNYLSNYYENNPKLNSNHKTEIIRKSVKVIRGRDSSGYTSINSSKQYQSTPTSEKHQIKMSPYQYPPAKSRESTPTNSYKVIRSRSPYLVEEDRRYGSSTQEKKQWLKREYYKTEEKPKVISDNKNLSILSHCFHYLIDSDLQIYEKVRQFANLKDNIVVCDGSEEILENMLKKPLPNTIYDLGFIFLDKQKSINFSRSSLQKGYYIVNLHQNNKSIQILREQREIRINSLQNLKEGIITILGPLIENLVFYSPNRVEEERLVRLFPDRKFQKHQYCSRSELERELSFKIKSNGRMVRVLIFTHEDQLNQMDGILDHHLNIGTFTLLCRIQGSRQKQQYFFKKYPKITFLTKPHYNSCDEILEASIHQQGSSHSDKKQRKKLPIIYLDLKHERIKNTIQLKYPSKYEVVLFTKIEEVRPNKKATVILHPESDFQMMRLNVREFECVYMLGQAKRVPSGGIRIQFADLMELLS